MAAIDVHMFLENLNQLMSSGLDFVASQRDELQIVYEYIKDMGMLLKSTEEEFSTDMVMHIRDLVFEAENIVDQFRFDSVSSGGGGDCDLSTKLDSVKVELEAIIKCCKSSKSELEWWYSKAANSTTHVVGLRAKIDKIMCRFQRGKHLEIITILGFPGIGKTTLAKQIYNDHCTKEKFEIRVWIKVCQGYGRRDFLAAILESFNPMFKEKWDTEEALGGQLRQHLQNHMYLIVMDDLWSAQALFDLQTYLPDQCNGSKIIVTTREPIVAKAIKEQDCYKSYAIRLDPLSEEDSLELFQRKLLEDQATVSKELEEFRKNMVKQCHGLPVAIAVISGVLARKSYQSCSSSATNTLAIIQQSYMESLMCRYNQLPPHLKACLLYIGSFPEDYRIPVRHLVWLLISEGLVTEEAVGIFQSPEVVAEGYISDLVDRCLVVVLEKRICGATRTCCISSPMREFCSAKAKESKLEYQACCSSATQNDPRRLFISCQANTRISLAASMQSLRSLLCFGDGGGNRCQINVDRIFCGNDFKLLKVLGLLSIPMDYPNEIGVMVHLTYLEVPWWGLPSSIANLVNLETLIFSYSSVTIYLPPGILKMEKLRHVCKKTGSLFFPLCFSRSDIVANSDFGAKLQTVYPLCGCTSCTLILTKSPRIRKLGLSGHALDIFYSVPDNLSLLEDLETLKLSFTYGLSGFKWPTNFQLQLPSSIRRLTLRSTFLEWEMISILGTLPNLEVLKLLRNACAVKEGEESCWDTSGQEFPRLKCLKMYGLDITKWVSFDSQFRSLEVLSIFACHKLEMLPSGLAQAPRLRALEGRWCNSYTSDFFASIVEESKAIIPLSME